jgi:uncharacterized protein (UPF0216 family)
MSYRPKITDDAVLRRWMSLEIGRINEGLAAEQKSLARLLNEEVPTTVTKGGGEYAFDREVIRRLGERLPADLHDRLFLPIIFRFTPDVKESCYLADRAAFLALQTLGELSTMRTMQKGRVWVSRAIVYAMMEAYPTAIQIGMG